MKKWDLHPISYQSEPIELAISKVEHSASKEIVSMAKKLEMKGILRFAEKSLKVRQLKITGRAKLSYLNRVTKLSIQSQKLIEILTVACGAAINSHQRAQLRKDD